MTRKAHPVESGDGTDSVTSVISLPDSGLIAGSMHYVGPGPIARECFLIALLPWLITNKVLLPGATVLERQVVRIRSRAQARVWSLCEASDGIGNV